MTIVRKMTGFGLVGSVAAAALAAPAFAQEAPPAANNGLLTWSLGVDVVSTYIFRGIEQEDSGLILQPWAEVGAPIGDTGLDFFLGTWNSFHSVDTGAIDSSSSEWYESRIYTGVSYDIEKFTLTGIFTNYSSPNGAFEDIEELAFKASYDDTEMFGDFAFAPYALLAFEVKDNGGSEDIYLELGGAFRTSLIESENMPVELSFPFALGLSVDDYYVDADGDNETFGYFKIGARASLPLDFIPADYGLWKATAGLDLYFVNDDAGLRDNADDDDDFEIVALIGVSMEY